MFGFMCVSVWSAWMCVCDICMPSALGGQKTVLEPLELELGMVVNYHIGVGNC